MSKNINSFPTAADINREVTNIAPGASRYRAIWQAVVDAQGLTPAPANPLEAITEDAAHTGDIPTPQELLDAAQATLTLDRDHGYVLAQLETIKRRYLTPPDVTTEQAASILDYLATALDKITSAIRNLPDDVPLTAEDALDRDNGAEDYRIIRALLAAYDAIRTQQRNAVKKIASSAITPADWTTMVAHSGTFKDATEHDTYWLDQRRAEFKTYANGLRKYQETGKDNGAYNYFAATPENNQWPALTERATWPTNHDTDEQRARWLIRTSRNLEHWVPTFEQLTTEHNANTSRVHVSAWTGAKTRTAWMIDRFGNRRGIEASTVVGVPAGTRTIR